VVEASKDILVNSERQTITFAAWCGRDIDPTNSVQSSRLAQLEVHIDGKGVVGDAIKRPFILYRLLLGILRSEYENSIPDTPAALLLLAGAAMPARLKDLVDVEGVRDNQLIGYGLWWPRGHGDKQQTIFPYQSLANVLERMGISVSGTLIVVKNTARHGDGHAPASPTGAAHRRHGGGGG